MKEVFTEAFDYENLVRGFLFILMLSALYNVNLPLDPNLGFLKDDEGNHTVFGWIYASFGVCIAIFFASMFFTSMRN